MAALSQFTAGFGHFGPSNADKLNVAAATLQSGYQARTVNVAARLSGTQKDTELVLCFRHSGIC
jgi:hypothetical protein